MPFLPTKIILTISAAYSNAFLARYETNYLESYIPSLTVVQFECSK
jgi:hypothetical protein